MSDPQEESTDYADYADYANCSKSPDIGAKDPETYAVIGAAMEVHRCLGHGFLEAVYQEAFAIELAQRDIVFEREFPVPIRYRGNLLTCHYRADFVCFGAVIVELKALAQIGSAEKTQILNYLKATGYRRGLLLNFGASSLQRQRLVWSPQTSADSSLSKSVESAKSVDKDAKNHA